MTFILIVSFLLIVFVGLLRYDLHKHKYREDADKQAADSESGKNKDGDTPKKS